MKLKIITAAIIFMIMNTGAQIKVDCIGNSITYGYGLSSPYTMSYPAILQKLLGSTYSVQNDGVNSLTVLKKGDNPYWKNGRLPQAFAFQPDIVILKLGTNDTKPQNWDKYNSEFSTDYLALVDTLASMASKPRIFVVLPVPVFDNPIGASWGIRDSLIKKEIPIINQIAAERGLDVIDCYTPLLEFPQYFSVDGVHPDAAGADTIAHIVYRAIKSYTSIDTDVKPLTRSLLSLKQTKNALSISVSLSGISIVNVFDLRGKQIKTICLNESEAVTIDTKGWKSAMYVLRLTNRSIREPYYQNVNLIKFRKF